MTTDNSWLQLPSDIHPIYAGVKSSLSSSPDTGSFWAGLATLLVTCPVDRLN